MERFSRWAARHLPRQVIYSCAVRLFAHATQDIYGDQTVGELTVLEAVRVATSCVTCE